MELDLGKDNLILTATCKIVSIFRDKHLLCGMTLPELFVCRTVCINDKMNKKTRARDIAQILAISKPAVSKLLNSMEEKGLIVRERIQEDRKAVFVVLTKKALDTSEEQMATASVVTKKVFAEMGMEKAKEFISLVDLFYDSYKKVEESMWAD